MVGNTNIEQLSYCRRNSTLNAIRGVLIIQIKVFMIERLPSYMINNEFIHILYNPS